MDLICSHIFLKSSNATFCTVYNYLFIYYTFLGFVIFFHIFCITCVAFEWRDRKICIQMDDHSCVLKYIEIVPLDNSAQQFEDIKPFEVQVCVVTNVVNHELTQWSSGSMLACSASSFRIEPTMHTVSVFSRKSLRYAALSTGCTLTAVPRWTQPSTLRGTVNEYQPHGWVIIPMAIGECSAYSSLYRWTERSSLQLGLWVDRLQPLDADRLSFSGP